MTDKELIHKLNNLKNVKPDAAWQSSNREILFSQISNTTVEMEISSFTSFWMITKNVFSIIPQTAYVTAAIVVFLVGGLAYGNYLPVKPNNSLYIAKIISEKARLSTTFDSSAKNRLEAQYASSHAQDIASTLSDPSFNILNTEEVNKLNDNFKTEIAKVKSSLPKEGDDKIVVADSEKATSGISVYDPNATGTDAETKGVKLAPSAKQILDDASKLFSDKDYSGALDKLREVDEIIK
jgi:hypothetical protein